jgi:phage terminase large subunit-like protein
MTVIIAFRDSGKSTLCTLSYPLWAILGREHKKFVVILSQTQRQAKQHLTNIRKELEQNSLLRSDLGPFREETDEWGGYSLVLTHYDARITAASSEQSIRGMRHQQHRPDVIIADDIEDIQSVRTQEGRNKTRDWFKGDTLPAGTIDTKVIVVGNLLHEDSLLRNMCNEIDAGTLKGVHREYPIQNSEGEILWIGKYPDIAAIQTAREKFSDENMWLREFMLKIIPPDDQVVHSDWIHYYENEEFPSYKFDKYSWTKVGIDLAISQKQTADYTAMVTGSMFSQYGDAKLYIHPFPINARLDFPSARQKVIEMAKTIAPGKSVQFLVEEVGYQPAFTQSLEGSWINVRGVKVGSLDKRSRLALVSHLIKNGVILFPKKGCELLIAQIIGFGAERHDDLMDAFVILASYALDHMRPGARPADKFDRI